MVQIYGAEETKAFCCNCKKVTFHKYESFSKSGEDTGKEVKGFFSSLFAAIASALMEGEPSGDYKCKVCGTNLHTPDYLD
ncbi:MULTISPECIES: hypothetical protein [Salinivibrio]|uniref:hypothetical protein n=1 Tax=Salinivibrio TaxID=51366 RepID=UPI000987CF0A|nr:MULTISPECIES: hypothetical protein [Salinivibrio]MPS33666.1 hypothetical protein [Salinivibrio sp. VYel7]MPX95049.1 hypothetical protein [Salinivibrio sp. VYel9]MPX96840.1 hypothetical protein [Salinivibrio sp. VYel6]MPX99727.1 hypothetical protein [Salinivibrio sp. VYel4]MPY04309.1 hypothetical protein [Salinivibrio sp. VYel5]